jgi:hypothetical protein
MTTQTSMETAVEVPKPQAFFANPLLRVVALLLLFTAAPLSEAVHLRSLSNSDIWWHTRTGLWILENHSIPRSGLFSQHNALPWIASSWGYEILAAIAYKLLGLRAIPTLLMGLMVALAVATFSLARGWRGNFWGAVVLSAIAQFAIIDLQPGPEVCSMLFVAVELMLLFHVRRRGDVRALFCLPPLFALWANLHIQFVNGLLLLAVFLLAEVVQHRVTDPLKAPALPLGKVGMIAGLSVLATLLTPYTVHLLPGALSSAYSKLLFEWYPEMSPMAFRRPQNFVLLLLAMAAFFALGRQRSRDPFKLAVMALSLVLAFRVQRDAWFVVLAAVAVLADFLSPDSSSTELGGNHLLPRWGSAVATISVLSVFAGCIAVLPHDQALLAKAARVFPAKAADFIRDNKLPAPLFNHHAWGGFLVWYLPDYPVAIDDRVNLYGPEITDRYFRITTGTQRFQEDPNFSAARTILLERQSDMALALTTLPVLHGKFRVAYQDDMAIILLPQ